MSSPNFASNMPAGGGAVDVPAFVDDYLPALLAQASHLISSEFGVVARPQGFWVSDWHVLATLAGGKPISIGELAQVTLIKQPTVTRLLDRMEANGPSRSSAPRQ